MSKTEEQKIILVPEIWLKSLLEDALEFERANEKWEYGKSEINDRIHFKAVTLMGYAKSASSVLKNKQINSDIKK